MTLLCDTHAFLWFLMADSRLSDIARSNLTDPANEIFVSIVSLWEMAIKVSIGKLSMPLPLAMLVAQHIEKADIQILALKPSHVFAVTTLPFHHKDPFDLILVCQSQVEHIPLLSADPQLDLYGIQRIW